MTRKDYVAIAECIKVNRPYLPHPENEIRNLAMDGVAIRIAEVMARDNAACGVQQ